MNDVQPALAAKRQPARPSFPRAFWLLLRKDLTLEWRTRTRLSAVIFFAFATLLLFSFAMGPDTKLLQRGAAGFLWLSILFASVLSLGESFRVESENGSLEGLRLIPVNLHALFLAKAIGNAALLLILSVCLLPPTIALYSVSPEMGLVKLGGVLLLGCLAISAPGTLYAAISANARARDVLLPVLLFPLLVPALLSAVKSTQLVITGDPMNQLPSWEGLLVVFNLIYWGLGLVLFPRVIED